MAQQYKLGTKATKIFVKGSSTCVKYHNTVVVKFTRKTITLNTGGWKTATTKTRMNQASNSFRLGFNVFSKSGKWFVKYRGRFLAFKGNTLTLKR